MSEFSRNPETTVGSRFPVPAERIAEVQQQLIANGQANGPVSISQEGLKYQEGEESVALLMAHKLTAVLNGIPDLRGRCAVIPTTSIEVTTAPTPHGDLIESRELPTTLFAATPDIDPEVLRSYADQAIGAVNDQLAEEQSPLRLPMY